MKLSIITHTRDSAATLPRLLETTSWADERLIVDMASTDDTVARAEAAGCRVLHAEVAPRVDGIRNDYLDLASNEWVLVLDSDEYLANDAEEAIEQLIDEADASVEAYAIPRFNHIGDDLLRSSGWYPDHQVRLFRRGTVRWSDSTHRPPEVRGGASALRTLRPPDCLHIHHDNYRDLQDVLERQLRYALNDRYDDDPEAFDFGDYVTKAYTELARRHRPEDDGDLSTALATIMSWDALVRGLIHWDRLGRRPPLEERFALPIATATPPAADRELAQAGERIAELEKASATLTAERDQALSQLAHTRSELATISGSTVWRAFDAARHRFPRTVAFVGGAIRRLRRVRGGVR